MILALCIVLPILTYLVVAGALWKPFQMSVIKRCDRCYLSSDGKKWLHKDRYGDAKYSTYVHDASPALALFWPLTGPFALGQWMGEHSQRRVSKEKRKALANKKRREEELTEQKHQVELARLRARENEYLDQHIKLAEIERRQDR